MIATLNKLIRCYQRENKTLSGKLRENKTPASFRVLLERLLTHHEEVQNARLIFDTDPSVVQAGVEGESADIAKQLFLIEESFSALSKIVEEHITALEAE